MSRILVTGASGLIGSRLIETLKEHHEVTALSRSSPKCEGVTYVRGNFTQWEDLAQLDDYHIDVVVHLAGVTGGCIEREGILVNVEGTRVLMQYLANRGCRKMVLASSIAAVGFQSTEYVPERLPIPDEDGCQDRHGYGVSKYLMEEMSRFVSRQKPELDIVNIRLSSAGTNTRVPDKLRPHGPWCLGGPTYMVVDDAVRLFEVAAESSIKPGFRIVNGVCSRAWTRVPIVEQLRHWFGEKVDVSWFEKPENKYTSIFDTSRLKQEFPAFEATKTLKILANVQKE